MTSSANLPSNGLLTVNLDALARNFRKIREVIVPGKCGAVVKANAYGLGMVPVASRLLEEGCRQFFVATVAEGLALRELLASAEIYVMAGPQAGEEVVMRDAGLIPVLNSHEQIVRWTEMPDSKRHPAVVHIDTGMARLGLDSRELNQLSLDTRVLERLSLAYVMTHLACADEPSNPMSQQQVELFDIHRAKLPKSKSSIGNSAGALAGEQFRGDLVRPGIALYGGNPFTKLPNPMETVVTFEAPVLQVREVTRPTTVGYGATRRIDGPARLATIAAGYADGIPLALSNKGAAFIGNVRVPIVGRVSMDLVTLDVSAVARRDIYPGASVELVGRHVLLEDVAERAGMISYEILTGIGSRVERRYVGDSG